MSCYNKTKYGTKGVFVSYVPNGDENAKGVEILTPEEKARKVIDARLEQSGWVLQDLSKVNPMASLGVAVREYPTSTGPVDYALFVEGVPVGVIEAKRQEAGETITTVETQSARYASSTFKWVKIDYHIRFAYEATDNTAPERCFLSIARRRFALCWHSRTPFVII